MEVTMITALFVVVLIWGIFIYIIGMKRDRKILNRYLANKHKMRVRWRRLAAAREAPDFPAKEKDGKEQKAIAGWLPKETVDVETD
ncbi:MAG: hypothetical protein M3342_15595 [Bacteroidota bacterium]|nr:hypothetical protein [Bacteroidota bacterium]